MTIWYSGYPSHLIYMKAFISESTELDEKQNYLRWMSREKLLISVKWKRMEEKNLQTLFSPKKKNCEKISNWDLICVRFAKSLSVKGTLDKFTIKIWHNYILFFDNNTITYSLHFITNNMREEYALPVNEHYLLDAFCYINVFIKLYMIYWLVKKFRNLFLMKKFELNIEKE